MSLEEAGTPNDQDVVTSPPDGRERVEGLGDKVEGKEMDILKDLPSYNSSNFSRLLGTSSAAITATATTGKNNSHTKSYVRLKRQCDTDEQPPQVIVTESESLILKELEAIIARQQAATRNTLKRSSSCRSDHESHSSSSSSSSYKCPRTDYDSMDSRSSYDQL